MPLPTFAYRLIGRFWVTGCDHANHSLLVLEPISGRA
jgi:hypothetical protein